MLRNTQLIDGLALRRRGFLTIVFADHLTLVGEKRAASGVAEGLGGGIDLVAALGRLERVNVATLFARGQVSGD